MEKREKKRKAKIIQRANEIQNLANRAKQQGRFVPSEIKVANTTISITGPSKLKKKVLKATEKAQKASKEDFAQTFDKAR